MKIKIRKVGEAKKITKKVEFREPEYQGFDGYELSNVQAEILRRQWQKQEEDQYKNKG